VERVYSPGEWAAIAFSLGDSLSVPARHDVVVPDRVPVLVPNVQAAGDVQLVELLSQYGWPLDEALRVVACESGGNPNATNGTSLGLFQINAPYHTDKFSPGESLYDPVVNVRVAYTIWKDGKWSAWSCQPY
jgi:hypothetical protein